jgi:hypothetical protein
VAGIHEVAFACIRWVLFSFFAFFEVVISFLWFYVRV